MWREILNFLFMLVGTKQGPCVAPTTSTTTIIARLLPPWKAGNGAIHVPFLWWWQVCFVKKKIANNSGLDLIVRAKMAHECNIVCFAVVGFFLRNNIIQCVTGKWTVDGLTMSLGGSGQKRLHQFHTWEWKFRLPIIKQSVFLDYLPRF